MKYTIGQYVYTAKNIPGWFNFSMRNFIPSNTICTIVSYKEPIYVVRFPKEFGDIEINEFNLKLDI